MFWPNIAISSEFVVATRELVVRVVVNVHLVFWFRRDYLVALQKHLYFQAQIVFVVICTHSQEIEAVFVIHSIFGVEFFVLLDFEELVVVWVANKILSLLELCFEDVLGKMERFRK